MLTPSQQQALACIRRHIAEHGHAPSLEEIAAGLGLKARSAAHRHVQALAAAGAIRLLPGRKRGIELCDPDPDPEHSLPLLGRIAAGRPIEAIPGEERLPLAELFLGPDRYALRVAGDSMIEAGILDGDTVILRACDNARDGDIVVALIDGQEATLKRLRRRPDGLIELIPANRSLMPLVYPPERVQIQGVLVGQLRRY